MVADYRSVVFKHKGLLDFDAASLLLVRIAFVAWDRVLRASR
jgi:hypothetical protein